MTNIDQKKIFELLNIDVRDSLIEFLDISIPYQGDKGWEKHIINALSSFQKSRQSRRNASECGKDTGCQY